jgi:hypothetical protein
MKLYLDLVKFMYSEKATKLCEMSTAETIFIRVVIIKWQDIAGTNKLVKCDFILHLKKLPDSLLSSPINLKSCPKSQSIHQKRKNLTQQLNHYRGLESQVFVTRLPLELCQKWSDFGSVKTKMTHCTLLSMQSIFLDIFGPILIESFSLEKIKLKNLLLACSQNTFFAITLRNQKMAAQIFYML